MTTRTTPTPPAPTTVVRVFRVVLGAIGLAAVGYGVAGLLDEPDYVDRRGVLRWLVGGLLLHDFVFAVAVFGTGWLVLRVRPGRGPAPWVRRTLLGGLATGTAATLITLPALLRPGPWPNPSVLPLDYGRNLAIVWGVIAVATGLLIAARKWLVHKPG